MLGLKTFAESPIASLAGDLGIVNVIPVGQVGTGAVGSLSFSLDINFLVSQDTEVVTAATAGLGTLTIIGDSNLSLTGLSSTSALGNAVAKLDIDVSVTGQSATSSMAGVGVNGSVVAILSNLTATVGSVSVNIDAEANVSIPLADEGESALGTPAITADAIVNDYGNNPDEPLSALTGSIGTPTTKALANVNVTGLSAISNLSLPTQKADANINVTGLAGTTTLGTAIQKTVNKVIVTGISATGSVTSPNISGKANFSIIGVSSSGLTNVVLIWGEVDESQNANYNEISVSQTPNYTNVNKNQTPNWEEVA